MSIEPSDSESTNWGQQLPPANTVLVYINSYRFDRSEEGTNHNKLQELYITTRNGAAVSVRESDFYGEEFVDFNGKAEKG